MATRFINVTLGSLRPDNTHNPIVSHAGSSSGALTVSYDDTQITTRGLLVEALRAAMDQARANGGLAA